MNIILGNLFLMDGKVKSTILDLDDSQETVNVILDMDGGELQSLPLEVDLTKKDIFFDKTPIDGKNHMFRLRVEFLDEIVAGPTKPVLIKVDSPPARQPDLPPKAPQIPRPTGKASAPQSEKKAPVVPPKRRSQ